MSFTYLHPDPLPDGEDGAVESPEVAKRRRRVRLARGWRFACECEGCTGKKAVLQEGGVPEAILPDAVVERAA
jgi:import receptor subunit TOM20